MSSTVNTVRAFYDALARGASPIRVRGDRPVVHRAIRHVEATLRESTGWGCRLNRQQVPLEVAVDQLLGDRCRPSNSLA